MTQRGSLYLPSRMRSRGGARAPSSNIAGWWCSRCERRCPSWTTICPASPRYASSFLVWCRFVLSLFTMHDPCSTYPGARGPVSREVAVPSSREGRLGPTWAAEGPARERQRASIGSERGGGGPPPSLCRYESRGGHGSGAGRSFGGASQGARRGADPGGRRAGRPSFPG